MTKDREWVRRVCEAIVDGPGLTIARQNRFSAAAYLFPDHVPAAPMNCIVDKLRPLDEPGDFDILYNWIFRQDCIISVRHGKKYKDNPHTVSIEYRYMNRGYVRLAVVSHTDYHSAFILAAATALGVISPDG